MLFTHFGVTSGITRNPWVIPEVTPKWVNNTNVHSKFTLISLFSKIHSLKSEHIHSFCLESKTHKRQFSRNGVYDMAVLVAVSGSTWRLQGLHGSYNKIYVEILWTSFFFFFFALPSGKLHEDPRTATRSQRPTLFRENCLTWFLVRDRFYVKVWPRLKS